MSGCKAFKEYFDAALVRQIAAWVADAEPRFALTASLPPKAPSGEGITDHGYALWPYGEFIARYGLDDVDASFACMLELTQRFTSEFAVRPFLARDPDGMLDRLAPLCAHESARVRRWVSEETRTRLPWGKRVPALEARLDRRHTNPPLAGVGVPCRPKPGSRRGGIGGCNQAQSRPVSLNRCPMASIASTGTGAHQTRR